MFVQSTTSSGALFKIFPGLSLSLFIVQPHDCSSVETKKAGLGGGTTLALLFTIGE